MIVLCEGPRGAGKSHLIDNFFAQNNDDRFMYYKWDFVSLVETLGLEEKGEVIHYFSLANILTILEMGNTIFKDKVLILDRSIFSAYVWALYRKRLIRHELITEFMKILDSQLYSNCKLVYITRDDGISDFNRGNKDIFDKYENYNLEKQEFDKLFSMFSEYIDKREAGNSNIIFNNMFNTKSQYEFNKLLGSFVDK